MEPGQGSTSRSRHRADLVRSDNVDMIPATQSINPIVFYSSV